MNRIPPALLLTLSLTLAAPACKKDVRDQVLTDQNEQQLLPQFAAAPDVTPDERTALAGYATRHHLAGVFGAAAPPYGLTIRAAIAAQQTFLAQQRAAEAAQRAAAERAEHERQAQIQTIRAMVPLTLVSLNYVPSDPMNGRYEDYLAFRVHVANTGAKSIHGTRGTLVFRDTFGEAVSRLRLNVEHDIDAGGSYDGEYTRHYNQFMEEDRALRGFDPSHGRVDWEPDMVVFTDGTQVAVPAQEESRR